MSDEDSNSTSSKGNREPAKKKQKKPLALKNEVMKNSQAIEKLKDVPKQLEEIMQFMHSPQNASSNTHNQQEIEDEVVIEDDPITNLIAKVSSDQVTPTQEDSSLLSALNALQPEPEYGEAINIEVAKSISQLYAIDQTKVIREKYKEKYKVPENCKPLQVPRVNPEIWPLLPAGVKQKDFAVQHQQQLISLAAVANARITNTLFETKEPINQSLREELIRNCMDVASILATASEDTNKRRKIDMKPALNQEYAGICNTSVSVGGLLFGENVIEQLKATKSSSQLVRSASSRGGFRGQRYSPFRRGSLNFQSPPFRGRGAFRQNRGRQAFRAYQHPQFQRSRGPQQ